MSSDSHPPGWAEKADLFRSLVEAQHLARLGSWEWDMVSNQVKWSPELFRVFDLDPEMFDGSPAAVLKVIHPDDAGRFAASMESNLAGGDSPSLEYRVIHRDGSIHTLFAQGRLERSAEGVPLRRVGTVQDITERKQAERALQESEERLRVLFHGAPDAIILANPTTGKILDVNQAACRLLGRERAAIVGLHQRELHPPQAEGFSQDSFARHVDESQALGFTHPIENSVVRPDGTVIPVEVVAQIVRLHDQPVLLGTFRDISARKQAEAALQQSHAMIVKLTAQVPGVVYQYRLFSDGRSCFPFSSQGMNDIYEVTPEAVREDATPVFGRLHPEDHDGVAEAIFASARTLQPFHCEFRVVLPRQGLRWRLCDAMPERMADGGTLWHGIISDITERKAAEAALQESEAFKVAILDSLVDHIAVLDERGVILAVNGAWKKFAAQNNAAALGTDVVGRNYLDACAASPGGEPQAAAVGIRAVLAGEQQDFQLEYPCHSPREQRWFQMRVSPLLGLRRGAVVSHRDITGRQVAERMLRLRGAALEAAASAIVITDCTGAIEWANPAFTALSGWPLAEAVGKNPRELVKSGEHDDAFYRQMWETVLAGKVWRGEIVNRRRDGALRTEDMTITPLRDERGVISHLIAIKQDITDHKVMEAHFLQAQRLEAIGALAGGVAHDLNNILAPISLVVGLLKDKLQEEKDRELVAMMQSSTRRGAEVIRQLLTFSRGQRGERSVVQLRHLINEMVVMMRETFPRDLDLEQHIAGELWTVVADPTQLHQVLMNLCVNARDAMPAGGKLALAAANLTLTEGDLRLPPHVKPGSFVVLDVSDTGHGIPPEIKHRIFDPFFTTKPLGKGTGLGLSTLLGIVRSHGGFVSVESAPGQGTTFHVYLPAVPAGAEVRPEAPVVPALPTLVTAGILVVDDERNIRDSTRAVLEHEGYQVLTATHGDDALAQYLRHRAAVSLVLTDVMMPVMNGVTLIRALRAIDPGLKIVATSGLIDDTQQRELAELGVTRVLSKPCDRAALVEAVRLGLAGT